MKGCAWRGLYRHGDPDRHCVHAADLADVRVLDFHILPLAELPGQAARHGIEVYGRADDETIRLISNGAFTSGDVTVNTNWHNATRRTIQLKTPFTVTVEKRIGIPILRFVTGNTVSINLRIAASADGISEVYWKAGS